MLICRWKSKGFQKLSSAPPPFLCIPASRSFGVGRLPPCHGYFPMAYAMQLIYHFFRHNSTIFVNSFALIFPYLPDIFLLTISWKLVLNNWYRLLSFSIVLSNGTILSPNRISPIPGSAPFTQASHPCDNNYVMLASVPWHLTVSGNSPIGEITAEWKILWC